MLFNESLFNFTFRQLLRIKIDQKKGIAGDPQIIRPNFKKYLKLFLVNKYPQVLRSKIDRDFRIYKNKITPDQLLEINIDSYHSFAFDIFGTIIYRRIPPETIKDLVSKYIAGYSNLKIDYLKIRNLRFQSELEIGHKYLEQGLDPDNKYLDVVKLWLEKLQTEFPTSKFPDYKEIKSYEIEKENQSQYTLTPIINFLKYLKQKNKRIIFISDFYFDSKTIFKLLKHLKIDTYFNEGFSSSDFLLTKKSGRLYEKLIQLNKLDPKSTLMIGDNPHSDNTMANKFGINSYLLYDIEQRIQDKKVEIAENLRKQNSFFESATMSEVISVEIKKIDDYDYNLGLMLAPLYITFVEKIIDYCIKNEIYNIYFLSREGKIFLNLFNKINDDPTLKGNYLMASRKSTYLISIKDISRNEIDRIWKQYNNQTPQQLLKNLNLPMSLLKVFRRNGFIDDEIIDQNYNYKKLNIILDDEEFQDKFIKCQNIQKKYFQQYCKSINLNNQKKIAIVDIGWKGSIQDNLARIFPNTEIHGLYLGYYKGHQETTTNNHKIGVIVDANTSDWYSKQLFQNGPLFEMSTTPNEGSCIGYGPNGPVTKKYDSEIKNYKNYFSKTQKAIYDYADIYKKYRNVIQIDPPISSYLPLDQVIRFIIYPNATEAKSFLRYSHVESFGIQETSKFTYKYRWKNVLSDINPIGILKRFKQNFYSQFWLQGIIKRTKIPFLNFIFSFFKQ